MGKIAFVFSGQGAQYSGMGKEIYESSDAAKAIFDECDSIRPNTSFQCFEGDKETLSQTLNTQPCVFATDLAIAQAIVESGITPDGVAGFSLGEVPALTFAGAMDLNTGFEFVCKRAEAMEKATKEVEGKMVAVMKMNKDDLESLAAEHGVFPVNYNSPMQIVVAGERDKIDAFSKEVKAKKGMAIPLAVSGAFHCKYMQSAETELNQYMQSGIIEKLNAPRIAVYGNVSATPYPNESKSIADIMTKQIVSPVRWVETISNMIEDGYDTFIEVGPGKTLTGLISKISKGVKVFGVENKEELNDIRK